MRLTLLPPRRPRRPGRPVEPADRWADVEARLAALSPSEVDAVLGLFRDEMARGWRPSLFDLEAALDLVQAAPADEAPGLRLAGG
jgi:serine/threonine protein kinase HipA of HipAB toxin-antitoxin module